MGEAGRERVREIAWDRVIEQLTGTQPIDACRPPEPAAAADLRHRRLLGRAAAHGARHIGGAARVELVVDDGSPSTQRSARVPGAPAATLRRAGARRALRRRDLPPGQQPRLPTGIYRSCWRTRRACRRCWWLHEYVLHHLVRDVTLPPATPAVTSGDALVLCRTGEAVARRAVATACRSIPSANPLFERAVTPPPP